MRIAYFVLSAMPLLQIRVTIKREDFCAGAITNEDLVLNAADVASV